MCSRKLMNRHFERKECFATASCNVLWEFLTEAKTWAFVAVCRVLPKVGVQGEWVWVGGWQWGASSIWPKFPEIPVQNRMEQKVSGNSFGKFQFTSRGCPFFWKFGNSRKFLFHLAFLPSMNQSEFLYSWKATRWGRVFQVNTALAAKWSAIVQACSWSPILHENVRIWFPGKLWTGHFEFPVGQFARFEYSPARKVPKFLS